MCMALNEIYRKYFQKSKIFLYPLLDIPRGAKALPTETYLSWNNKYTTELYVFIKLKQSLNICYLSLNSY